MSLIVNLTVNVIDYKGLEPYFKFIYVKSSAI